MIHWVVIIKIKLELQMQFQISKSITTKHSNIKETLEAINLLLSHSVPDTAFIKLKNKYEEDGYIIEVTYYE